GDRPVQRALPGPLPGGGSGLGGGPPGPGGWDGPPAGGGWRGSEALIVFHRCRRGVPGRETCREDREVVIRLRPEKRAGPPPGPGRRPSPLAPAGEGGAVAADPGARRPAPRRPLTWVGPGRAVLPRAR